MSLVSVKAGEAGKNAKLGCEEQACEPASETEPERLSSESDGERERERERQRERERERETEGERKSGRER